MGGLGGSGSFGGGDLGGGGGGAGSAFSTHPDVSSITELRTATNTDYSATGGDGLIIISYTPIPEPSSALLIALGATALLNGRRRTQG